MRTYAILKNFTTPEGKDIIIRNLNRILDIRILDLDMESGAITFLCATQSALEKAKRELSCIGFPIQSLQIQNGQKTETGLSEATI